MKKLLVKSFVAIFVGSLFMVGSAFALPWDNLGGDYVVSTGMDYWSATDLTTNTGGNSWFQIQLEQASYESAFGLYTLAADGTLAKKFEIFNQSADPFNVATLTFRNDNGLFQLTKTFTDDGNLSNDGWIDFDSTFGFYYDVNQGYTFFTDNALNTTEAGIEHITTAYSSSNKDVYIYLDDQLGSYPNRDNDWTDMTVFANDVAPVPEPATMLLFGTGLVGLAGAARKKKTKK